MKILILFFSCLLVVFSKQNLVSAQNAIELCLKSIIPALFPYFVLSGLIIRLGMCNNSGFSKISRPIFGTNSALSLFVLGIIAGYPLGTKNICDLYTSGQISKNEAERLLYFCCNSGPAFIIGVAGCIVFSSVYIGVFLYLIHILSAALVGILINIFTKKLPKTNFTIKTKYESFPSAFTASVKNSAEACINVSAFVVFFGIIIGILPKLNPLFMGLLELGSGLNALLAFEHLKNYGLLICSFILAFGGISVHFQALSFLLLTDLKAKNYLLGKVYHAFSALALTFLALLLKIIIIN